MLEQEDDEGGMLTLLLITFLKTFEFSYKKKGIGYNLRMVVLTIFSTHLNMQISQV